MLIYDKALYDDLYEATLPDGRVIHYGREFLELGDPPHWLNQRNLLKSLGVIDQVLLVGCGFSPLLESFDRRTTWGTDPSPFIQANLRSEVKNWQRVLPYGVPDKRLRSGFKWVITDDVLPGYPVPEPVQPIARPRSNPEVEGFLDGCTKLGDTVIHFITPGRGERGDSRLTWLSMDAWSQLAPDHIWIDNQTMQVHRG